MDGEQAVTEQEQDMGVQRVKLREKKQESRNKTKEVIL